MFHDDRDTFIICAFVIGGVTTLIILVIVIKHVYQVGVQRIQQLSRYLRRISLDRRDFRKSKSDKSAGKVVESVHDLEYGDITVSNSDEPGLAPSVSRYPSFYPLPAPSTPASPFDFQTDRRGKRVYPAREAPIPERPYSRLSSYTKDELADLPATAIARTRSMERIRQPKVYEPYSPANRPLSAQDIRAHETQRAQSRPADMYLPTNRPPLSSDFDTSRTSSPCNSFISRRSTPAVKRIAPGFTPTPNYRCPPPVHIEGSGDSHSPRQATTSPPTRMNYHEAFPSYGLSPENSGGQLPHRRAALPFSSGPTRSPAPSILSHPSNIVMDE